jgi:FkbM family methyltransferase
LNPTPHPVDLQSYLAERSRAEREVMRIWPSDAALTIFDIGCCEGEDSIRFARRFPNARVFSFEPLPANQALVRINFEKYHVTNTELVPLALSDRVGTAVFHVSTGEPKEKFAGQDWNYGNKSSSLLPPSSDAPMHGWIRFPEKITVQCSTFDEFCRQRTVSQVDFVHMDVQGAEWLVLQGAAKMLPRIGALCLEYADAELYAGQKLRTDIEKLLRAAGFALVYTEARGTEGDQFYVNQRNWRGKRHLTTTFLRRVLGGARRKLRLT